MAAFYSLLCKAIKKQPAGRSGRLFWRSGRDSNPRAIARKLISRCLVNHSDKIRRKFLSNSSSQIHSHTLLPIHLIVRLRMR